MKPNVMIIGAGASGRGYIARLLSMDGAQITFVDAKTHLVDQLNAAGAYTVYMGREKKPFSLTDYTALSVQDPAAPIRAAESDYVFVSVGEQNLCQLRPFFQKRASLGGVCRIVVCENGIAPKLVLRKALEGLTGCSFLVTQAVIFCTTIPAGGVDILSEDFSEMRYDADEALFELPFAHFPPQKRFDVLLERKIYTYNCLSACIAYTGYLKGYTDYARAANDPQIRALCRRLSERLTRVISQVYDIPLDEQQAFTQRALDKFTDSAISDTINKNARTAVRKLSEKERLIGPLNLFLRVRENPDILCFVTACALVYLRREEEDTLRGKGYFRPMDLLLHINQALPGDIAVRILHDYEKILSNTNVAEVLDRVLAANPPDER